MYSFTQEEMSAMKESLECLGKELAVVEQEETKMRSKEVDIKHEVEKYETVLKENQQKVKHWQKEVYQLPHFIILLVTRSEYLGTVGWVCAAQVFKNDTPV